MARPNLHVVAGRPASFEPHLHAEALPPVLTDELKHVRPQPLKRWARELAEAALAALLIAIGVYLFLVFMLGLR